MSILGGRKLQIKDKIDKSAQALICLPQEFVATLDSETKDKVLIKMLNMGRGSLDFAKKLATEDPPDPEQPDEDSPQWCKCHVCRPMPDEQENVCCKRVRCITTYTTF